MYKKYKVTEVRTPIDPHFGEIETYIGYIYQLKGMNYRTKKL